MLAETLVSLFYNYRLKRLNKKIYFKFFFCIFYCGESFVSRHELAPIKFLKYLLNLCQLAWLVKRKSFIVLIKGKQNLNAPPYAPQNKAVPQGNGFV